MNVNEWMAIIFGISSIWLMPKRDIGLTGPSPLVLLRFDSPQRRARDQMTWYGGCYVGKVN
jgi:hypothetical protein